MGRLRFVLRQVLYDLRAGLLLVPALYTLSLAVLATALVSAERYVPAVAAFARKVDFVFDGDASAAQVVLGTIAGSMMAVLSIVYSVLLMTLTLASMQFSPRILSNFVRDRVSQRTLGGFVGCFTYCLLVLRSVRGSPEPFVPVLAITGSILLALVALGGLVYFIHHISRRIQVNYIIEAIADETEALVDSVFPHPWTPTPASRPTTDEVDAVDVRASDSGYVQMVDDESLAEIARVRGIHIHCRRKVGQFAVEGCVLASVSPADRVTEELQGEILGTFDLGPIRTMQQDVELGLRQLVDIALKAISPAVNDPSTAGSCIDQLARLLARLAQRRLAPAASADPAGSVEHLETRFVSLLDLAFNQLRQYGKGDMAVSLRMLRALDDIASVCRDPVALDRIAVHGRLIGSCCEQAFPAEDRHELGLRTRRLESTVARSREGSVTAS